MHANQGFYKSEKVNELLSESAPYLTVLHPFTLCLCCNHNQDGNFFVLVEESPAHHPPHQHDKGPDAHKPESNHTLNPFSYLEGLQSQTKQHSQFSVK